MEVEVGKKKKKKVLLSKSLVLKCCIYFITFSHSMNKSNVYYISAASCMGISESGCFYYSSLGRGTDLPFLTENSLQVQTMRQTLCSPVFILASFWASSNILKQGMRTRKHKETYMEKQGCDPSPERERARNQRPMKMDVSALDTMFQYSPL